MAEFRQRESGVCAGWTRQPWATMRAWLRPALEPLWLSVVGILCVGCAGSQTRPAAVQEIVFDTASVVEAAPEGRRSTGPTLGSQALPPLPVDLKSASKAFRQGWELAGEFLKQPPPEPPKEGRQEAFQAWLQEGFLRWLEHTGSALERALKPLHLAASGPVGETVVAAALEALMLERLSEIVASIPPPPKLREDRELLVIYRQGLDETRSPWLQNAGSAFRFCASQAARQNASPYGEWRRFCAQRALQLAQLSRQIEERAREAERQREEARAKLIGPRPVGPAHCWQPKTGTGPEPPRSGEPPTESVRFVLLIDDGDGPSRMPLLGQEREELREAAQKHLEQRFAELVKPEAWLSSGEIAKWKATWKKGRAAPAGRQCARAPDRYRVLRAIHPSLFVAKLSHHCADRGGQCRLVVGFDAPSVTGFGGQLAAELSGPLHKLDTWMTALPKLAPPGPQHVAAEPRPSQGSDSALVVRAADAYGAWPDAAEAKTAVQAAGDRLLRCRSGSADALQTYEAVLQIDARGRVQQLWRPAVERRAEAQYRCVDKTLQRVFFSAAEDDSRRLSLVLGFDTRRRSARDQAYGSVDPQTGVRVSLRSEDSEAFDPIPLHSRVLQGQLASCLAGDMDEAQQSWIAVDASIAVSETGRVQSVNIASDHATEKAPQPATPGNETTQPGTDAAKGGATQPAPQAPGNETTQPGTDAAKGGATQPAPRAPGNEATQPVTDAAKGGATQPAPQAPGNEATQPVAGGSPVSSRLEKCVRNAMEQVAFPCSATGRPAELTVRVCMQRAQHERPETAP